MFRGFLFRGFVHEPCNGLHGLPGILVIALIWSLLHIQYDWVGVGTLFAVGVMLGYVRLYPRHSSSHTEQPGRHGRDRGRARRGVTLRAHIRSAMAAIDRMIGQRLGQADAGGSRRAVKGRDREMVADHQAWRWSR
jgi:Type II CAAX prenyl endopeptidase Rce1-like